jgi:metal-sulfur cluster biosynthetic enzyme
MYTMETDASNRVKEHIYEALRRVYDPELGVNVVDLGLVYGVEVLPDGRATITMTLTTPGCPMHESLAQGVAAALATIPEVTGGEVHLVWHPPWDPSMMSDEGRAQLGYPG